LNIDLISTRAPVVEEETKEVTNDEK